jgi:hypothetical protein
MKFSVSNGVIKVFELFKDSPELRRMYYWTLVVVALFALPALVDAFS